MATGTSDPVNLTQSFQYDDIDRITYTSKAGTCAYPLVGQLRPHGPIDVAGVPLSYDPNGDLESGQGRTLLWDAENRMESATVGSTTVSFTDDGLGTRLKKTDGGSTSIYPFGDDYEITDGEVTKYWSVPGLGVVAKRVGYGSGSRDVLASLRPYRLDPGRDRRDGRGGTPPELHPIRRHDRRIDRPHGIERLHRPTPR